MAASSRRERLLFNQALQLEDVSARAAFLDRECADDPALRARMNALLSGHARGEALFSSLPAAFPAAVAGATSGSARPEDCITQIGRYRLIERIGEGGHGIVYRAEQQEPVRRQVALKIIRPGMDTEALIYRFEAERQALALMEHPFIARVLDAGATASGRPFFVMEWVQGERITSYCDRNRLSLERRLELLACVCQAVQHAHQKGVIHRDLKPSNILVVEIDGQPAPKVIDFGIAKAAGPRLSEHTLHTAEWGAFIGTPAYMSPENAEGAKAGVDTRGDVFSLGVVLCELLVGHPPFSARDWARLPPDEIARIVRGREALRPSVVFAGLPPAAADEVAGARGLTRPRLGTALHGDLDWIVLKALAPDRERRYESAAALASDLRAHLSHAVVSARPPSRLYQIGRFVRRNRGPVTASLLVLASLLGGLVVATRLYFREQRALHAQVELFNRAEQARASELLLRRRAEAAEQVARAAVLLAYSQVKEADSLLAGLDLSLVQPTLESSRVFFRLGEWHGQAGRWTPAARYLAAFAESIIVIDPSDTDSVSGNLLPAATTMLRAGKRADYERFRSVVLGRFGGTKHPVAAEQVLKFAAISPVDAESIPSLQPLFDTVLKAVVGSARDDFFMRAWREFALGLVEYRRGNPREAIAWADTCLRTSNKNPPRVASAEILRALAFRALDQDVDSAYALHRAQRIVDKHRSTNLSAPDQQGVLWFDWINVDLLREEYEALPKPGRPPETLSHPAAP